MNVTDRQTDDMQSQYRAIMHSASPLVHRAVKPALGKVGVGLMGFGLLRQSPNFNNVEHRPLCKGVRYQTMYRLRLDFFRKQAIAVVLY